MPSSRPNTVPTVIHLVRQLQPRSILDVGVGFGKWGHLFREYTDIQEAERDPARYQRHNWQVKIDGIEGYSDYLTEMHRYLYNEIYTGDALEVMKKISTSSTARWSKPLTAQRCWPPSSSQGCRRRNARPRCRLQRRTRGGCARLSRKSPARSLRMNRSYWWMKTRSVANWRALWRFRFWSET